jgi:predicted DNA-binding WGR domain protein
MSCQLIYRIDPEQNMARFYRVEMLADLFGDIIVERRWGRIGSDGQCRSSSFPTIGLAEAAAFRLVRAKERRGYLAEASRSEQRSSFDCCTGQPRVQLQRFFVKRYASMLSSVTSPFINAIATA